MGLTETRAAFREIAAAFFTGAKVRWAEQTEPKPVPPFVTVKFGPVTRTVHPVRNAPERRCYHCHAVAEVNLYTKGRPVSARKDVLENYSNTAAADLLAFTDYLDSDAVLNRLARLQMGVMLKEQIRDLSFLEHDTAYRYRAMAEYDVTFVEEAGGWYGIGGSVYPNPSGGGTEEMASEAISYIEEAEIEETT